MMCPVCHAAPVRPRLTKAGVPPTTCSRRCDLRRGECRRQGIPIDTPVLTGPALTEVRRAGGRKRKAGGKHPLPDGTTTWATPEGVAKAQEAWTRAQVAVDVAVGLARTESLVTRVELIEAALHSWFLRGFIRGRAQARRGSIRGRAQARRCGRAG